MGDERRRGGCFSTVPGSGVSHKGPNTSPLVPPAVPGSWAEGHVYHPSHHIPVVEYSQMSTTTPAQLPGLQGALLATSSITLKTPPLTTRQATVHPLCADSCSGGHRLIPLQEAPINCALRYNRHSHNSDRSHFFPAQSLPEQSSSMLKCFCTFMIWTM